jgi:hypothetical protein
MQGITNYRRVTSINKQIIVMSCVLDTPSSNYWIHDMTERKLGSFFCGTEDPHPELALNTGLKKP